MFVEDSRMEKKSANRLAQPQPKSSAVDCKKSSDSVQKPWPRNNRKREGPGTSKNEPYRKNVPAQRGRGPMDRRPRPRGSGHYGMGGAENTWLAEDEAELGSVFVPGSKKQSLNHLLNFSYTPRGVPERSGPAPRRNHQQRASNPHNNDLYLHACCQFVVKEDGDYKANLLDPDVPVKWEQIEEVVVRSTGKSECPICLGTPIAGRVGKCGHVYCWPCALHYAQAHDKQPPPCPVCAAPFRVELMKPARVVQWETSAENVSMRLVRRLRGSNVVEAAPPRGEMVDAVSEILPHSRINDAPYCKMFAANKEQIQNILQREREELNTQILAEIDITELPYMEQGLEMLKKQEQNLNLTTDYKPPVVEQQDVPIVYEKQKTYEKVDWFNVDVDEEGATCLPEVDQISVDQISVDLEKTKLNPDAPEFGFNQHLEEEEFTLTDGTESGVTNIDKENHAKYFYFYQAEDGQQIFLNSLNVRVLNSSWGALAAAPALIKGRVLHRETYSLTEQTRKHMPFTAHLPLHCPFDIVELDLQPPHVSADALLNYADELDRRAKTRARQEREEKRRERAYRRTLEGPPKPDFSSQVLFPSPPKYTPPVNLTPPELPTEPSVSPNVAQSPSGLSFAKMAGTSGVWRAKPPRAPTPPPQEEDDTAAPRQLNFKDIFEAAHLAPTTGKGKNKKKKSKPQVLFATGVQYNG